MSAPIRILLNGAPREFPAPLTLAQLLDELALAGRRPAARRNGGNGPRSEAGPASVSAAKTLYPHMPETLAAAKTLVAEGFHVMAYCSDDPIMAKQLEELGCVAVMPLASLIGSGMGIVNPWNLQIIIEHARVPVLVDAGIGTASDAPIPMELGCDGGLSNTAIAKAKDPVRM